MANESVLRSFLMSIGFKIDEDAYRKFKETQQDVDKTTKNLSTSLEKFGTIAAASAAVLTTSIVKISERLSALYYSSELADSSAKNLNAFKSAAEQIGISADNAQAVVLRLASALRTMPGLAGILQAMNINPNQDKVQVLLQLIDKLRTLPYAQAVQYAKLFGIDEETLKLMEDHREELGKLFAKYQELNKSTTQQTEQARHFRQALQDLETRFAKLWDIIATRLMPVGEVLIKWLSQAIDLLLSADKATDGWSSRILGIASAIGTAVGGLKILGSAMRVLGIGGAAEETAAAAGGAGAIGTVGGAGALVGGLAVGSHYLGKILANTALGRFFEKYGSEAPEAQGQGEVNLDAQGNLITKNRIDRKLSGVSSLVNSAAKMYGIDENLFRSLIFQESQGNIFAQSIKGALGLAQLMPGTAKDLGVTNVFDPWQNLLGGAKYFSDLLRKYGGNEMLALAAYNAGPKAVKKFGGIPPFLETQDYIGNILQYRLAESSGGGGKTVTVHQNPKVDIHVNGSRDPHTVAHDVLEGQKRVNSAMQRDGQGVIR